MIERRQAAADREAAAAVAGDPDPLPRDPRHARARARPRLPAARPAGAGALGQHRTELFEQAQAVPDREGLAQGTPDDARGRRAGAGRKRRRGQPRRGARSANVAGGIFGIVTILILTFYMLVDSWSPARVRAAAVPEAAPRARRRGRPRRHDEGQRLARRSAAAGRGRSAPRRRSGCGRSAFRSSTCWRCCRRSAK